MSNVGPCILVYIAGGVVGGTPATIETTDYFNFMIRTEGTNTIMFAKCLDGFLFILT